MSRGRPGGYLGGRPGPKTFTPWLGAQESKVFCEDILDPKARRSMTRGGSQENFGLMFRSPVRAPSKKPGKAKKKTVQEGQGLAKA